MTKKHERLPHLLIVEARFYDDISDALLKGAIDALEEVDASYDSCRGLLDLSVHKKLAIGNGILTVENDDQAWARAKSDEKNKGGFAAKAALRMIELKKEFGVDH